MFDTGSTDIKPKKKRISGKREIVSAIHIDSQVIQIEESILRQIGKIADELGVELYVVGGYVRDYYLGKLRNDYDITIIGDPISFAEEIARRFNSKAVIYPKFRTALVPIGDLKCEFVGTRKEEYKPDSRKPIVTEGTLEDDLRRRDFTINAMAISLNQENFGVLIDKFNGKSDLDKKLLRTPLEPLVTFNDDPLRMMRAARFAAQLGFFVDNICIHSIRQIADRISIISQERITDELLKILASPKPSIGLVILYETGLLRNIFPELFALAGVETRTINGKDYHHKDILFHTFQVVDNLSRNTENLWLRFAALVHDIAKPKTKGFTDGLGWTFHGHEEVGARLMDKIFRHLKLPMEHLPYVEKLVRMHQRPMVLVDDGVTDSAVRRLAFHAGDALEDLFELCKSDITTNNPKLNAKYLNNYDKVFQKVKEVQIKDKLRDFQSPVRGEEIMELCGIGPSLTVGLVKSAIEEAILDGIIPNDYEAAKAYFLENKNLWLKNMTDLKKRTK